MGFSVCGVRRERKCDTIWGLRCVFLDSCHSPARLSGICSNGYGTGVTAAMRDVTMELSRAYIAMTSNLFNITTDLKNDGYDA